MVSTPSIQNSQAGAVVTANLSGDIHLSLGVALVVANFPTDFIQASQAGAVVITNHGSGHMQVSQAAVMVVARGRVYNPKLKAWTYTLDGHDFYVLRLSESRTFVYDLSTGQWSQFTSGDLNFWRPNIGMNWYSPGSIPETYGSNVICGDDTFGHLWILNPDQGYDDEPADPPGDPQRFTRVATGQVVTRQRKFLPVYEVYLTGSFGQPVLTADEITLSYSDDLGNTYVSAGDISVTSSDYNQEFAWRSLGLVNPSGRLFKITDDGAFARIDSLDCHIGGIDE